MASGIENIELRGFLLGRENGGFSGVYRQFLLSVLG